MKTLQKAKKFFKKAGTVLKTKVGRPLAKAAKVTGKVLNEHVAKPMKKQVVKGLKKAGKAALKQLATTAGVAAL